MLSWKTKLRRDFGEKWSSRLQKPQKEELVKYVSGPK